MILRPYQEVGRDFLASRRHALLADEMRVGKTPQAILAAYKLGAKTITVATIAIAVEHWHREFRKWWPGEILPRINIMSHDKARRMYKLNEVPLSDVFIPDECHFARNPEAQLTHAIYGKNGFGWRAGASWALSGTPVLKHAGNIYPLLKAFGVVGMCRAEFERRYCTFDWTGKITGTNTYRAAELNALMKTIMLRRMRSDVAPEMPAIDFQFLPVDPVSHRDLPGKAGMSDEQLLSWMGSFPSADREDRVAVAFAKALPLVENIVFAIENDLLKHTVVFGWHIEPLEAVVTSLRLRGISAELLNGSTSPARRVEIQDNFRHGNTQVVVANIVAAGAGIDLSTARHGYFLELDWLPSNNMQAANRLIDMVKSDKVTFDIATWPGSADDRVQKILLRRAQELSRLY